MVFLFRRTGFGELLLGVMLAGLGGGLRSPQICAQENRGGESAAAPATEAPLRAGDVRQYSQAVQDSVRLVLLGAAGILVCGLALAWAMIYRPRELKPHRPFDPEAERIERATKPGDTW
jgi:ABC-type Fe3+ transport system permease subunit